MHNILQTVYCIALVFKPFPKNVEKIWIFYLLIWCFVKHGFWLLYLLYTQYISFDIKKDLNYFSETKKVHSTNAYFYFYSNRREEIRFYIAKNITKSLKTIFLELVYNYQTAGAIPILKIDPPYYMYKDVTMTDPARAFFGQCMNSIYCILYSVYA